VADNAHKAYGAGFVTTGWQKKRNKLQKILPVTIDVVKQAEDLLNAPMIAVMQRRKKRLHILQHRKTALVSTKIAAVVGDIWTLVAVT